MLRTRCDGEATVTDQAMRRAAFDLSADDYEAARPGYPAELVEDVIRLSALPADADILEIGCGTGKATEPFAERGYRLLCLDIGANLLAIARRKFDDFPNVELVRSSFEEWSPGNRRFHLAISGTAFHWVEPEPGYRKLGALLRSEGAAAIFSHYHPRPFSGFFEEVQVVYEEVVPEWPDPRKGGTHEDLIGKRQSEMEAAGVFGPITVARYCWSKTYSATGYIQLLNTYSDHLTLPDERRKRLYDGVVDLIGSRYGGSVERPYLTILCHARKQV